MRRLNRVYRYAALLGSSALIFQLPGCTNVNLVELVQTVFLGVTAAGSLVLIRNL